MRCSPTQEMDSIIHLGKLLAERVEAEKETK